MTSSFSFYANSLEFNLAAWLVCECEGGRSEEWVRKEGAKSFSAHRPPLPQLCLQNVILLSTSLIYRVCYIGVGVISAELRRCVSQQRQRFCSWSWRFDLSLHLPFEKKEKEEAKARSGERTSSKRKRKKNKKKGIVRIEVSHGLFPE